MTYSCKGFIANSNIVNNNPKQTARFGELSTMGRTFTTDLQQLSDAQYAGIEVLVMSNHVEGDQVQVTVHKNYANILLEFSNWLYQTAPGFNSSTTQVDVVAAIANRFQGVMTTITVDQLVYDGVRYLPTRVAFDMHVANMPQMSVVLWTADTEFRSAVGYDEWEIRIVPPLDNIDVFLGSYAAVTEALSVSSPARDMQRIEQVADGDPYTAVVPMEINWIDPTDISKTVLTTWYAVVYGPRGTSTDITLAATVDYILSHSSGSSEDWKILFPDLFRITRFLMLPLWYKAAIEGRTGLPTIYSPVIANSDMNGAKLRAEELSQGGFFIDGYESFNHPYRSLALISFPGSDNRSNALSIWQAFPDYIAQGTLESGDWDRQSEKTKQFSNMLSELIRQSESYTAGKIPPAGYRVVTISTTQFMSTKNNNIEFLMQIKNQATL